MQITDIYQYWQKLEGHAAGRWLFNRLIPFINPYTGSLKANVLDLRKGYVKTELKDRRGIRNHLNSIHAIALTNLGEFTSGLALITQFTENMRGIPVEIKINFLKKARGRLTAECTTSLPIFNDSIEHKVMAIIKDAEGDDVANVIVIWKLGYKME
jgi:acyl-coenzyme A thioesterase PaaI-like protein